MKYPLSLLSCIATVFVASTELAAAQAPSAPAPVTTPATQAANPESLVLYFDLGSSVVRPQDRALLDQASRLYRDGHPVIMIVSGSADTLGSPEANLAISQQRATAVLHGLVARGIPAERFQLLAKGETEPAVPTKDGVAEARNRRVEIRWR